jgi:hypothetical protein
MAIHQLLYVSAASEKIDEPEIDRILALSRKNNPAQEITGVLLFRGGIFLQLLEGEKNKVEQLFAKIEKDPRHNHIIRVLEVDSNERIYTDWSMAYRKLEDIDVKFVNQILSWNKLISATKDLDNHLILQMLTQFKERVRT